MSKKIIDITRLVVLFIILALLVLIFINVTRGSKASMIYNSNPVLNEEYSGVSKVVCNMSSCALRVMEHDSDKVVVKAYTDGFPEVPAPKVSMDGGILNIEQLRILHIGFFIRNSVEIYVPRGCVMDYSLRTSSGSIRLDAKSGEAVLSSSSGSIKVYQGGSKLDVNCTSGSIRIYEPFVSEKLHCSSGSIKSIAGENSQSVDISCTSGSVCVGLKPENIGYSFSAHATSGSIKDEYHDSRFGNDAQSSNGDGKLSIQIRTTSGSIRLDDWID